jgi:hypothetical protein
VIANNAPLALWTAQRRTSAAFRLGSDSTARRSKRRCRELRPGRETRARAAKPRDARVVATVNAVAAQIGEAPIAHVRDLFAGCDTWLFTLPELDHYGARSGRALPRAARLHAGARRCDRARRAAGLRLRAHGPSA